MSDVIGLLRSLEARKAVTRRYAAAYERFAEEEQVLVAEGRIPDAEGAHWHAAWVARAMRNEIDDPEPREPH